MQIIRRYKPEDWSSLWPLLHSTFAAGDTYAFSPDSTEAEIHSVWIEAPLATYVVTAEDGSILGTYKLQSNQPGLGSHISNCGYVVAPNARGQGIASTMCEHSQAEAMRLGFKAMQFNLVVSTNEVAVRLWKKHGFAIVGTLPGAFQHKTQGYVDAYIMFKPLAAHPFLDVPTAYPLSQTLGVISHFTQKECNAMNSVNLSAVLSNLSEAWQPATVARFNGNEVMVAKAMGAYAWHKHEDTDDFFLVLKGNITIEMRDRSVHLGPGEMLVIPRGVEHRPIATEEAHFILIEPSDTAKDGTTFV